MIEFAGIRSDERYLIVEHYPARVFPKRKYATQTIPGRSGTLYIPESDDAFENYEQSYAVFLDSKAPGLPMASRGLAEWLLGNPGYQRLEDSYDPDFYRMAVYTGGAQFLNHFNEYGRGSLTFDCAPKRFYKIGEVEVTPENGAKLYSPSTFGSKPIIKIYGSGTCSVTTVAKDGTEKTFTIESVTDYVTVDSERHTALNSGLTSVNSNVTTPYESLYLDSETTISWSEGTTSVKIIPRWWTV